MSITYKSAIVYGCKIKYEDWDKGYGYCETYQDFSPYIPDEWEDFFIRTNDYSSENSEFFIGFIVSEIDIYDVSRRILPWIHHISKEEKDRVRHFYIDIFGEDDGIPHFDFWQTIIVS